MSTDDPPNGHPFRTAALVEPTPLVPEKPKHEPHYSPRVELEAPVHPHDRIRWLARQERIDRRALAAKPEPTPPESHDPIVTSVLDVPEQRRSAWRLTPALIVALTILVAWLLADWRLL